MALKKEMENYFINYGSWVRRIQRECTKRMPDVKWFVANMTIDRAFDGWDDGVPVFYIRAVADNGHYKKFALAADFLDRSWDEIMEYLANEGRTLLEAVKEELCS